MLCIDLHAHSYFSDGELSPTALVEHAKASGVDVLALTDHDSIDGLAEAVETAKRVGIQLIQGIELSTQWYKPISGQAIGLHIIGLDLQDLAPLQAVLVEQQLIRADRAKLICEKLEKVCKINPWEDLLTIAQGRAEGITRAHIATWLVDKGFVTRQQQAFDRYLGEGKSAYVPLAWMSLQESIDVITACGGFAVLAHPARYNTSATALRQIVADFKKMGGHGIELAKANEPSGTRDLIHRFATQHELLVSTASDFHGSSMPWHRLGVVPPMRDGQVGIWTRFKHFPADGLVNEI